MTNKGRFKHGYSRTTEHNAWKSMKARCYNKNYDHYKDYGGRGIIVCDRWLRSFENFISDMGEKPTSQHSVDRIDNNGNYEPVNCRWATRKEQARNKRSTIKITHNGAIKTISELATEHGLKYETLRWRIMDKKWELERALVTPVQTHKTAYLGN